MESCAFQNGTAVPSVERLRTGRLDLHRLCGKPAGSSLTSLTPAAILLVGRLPPTHPYRNCASPLSKALSPELPRVRHDAESTSDSLVSSGSRGCVGTTFSLDAALE
jgi:hypothetical protein